MNKDNTNMGMKGKKRKAEKEEEEEEERQEVRRRATMGEELEVSRKRESWKLVTSKNRKCTRTKRHERRTI